MKYTYYFRQIDYTLECKNEITAFPNKVIRSLFASLSRRKLQDKLDVLYNLTEPRTCGFCDKPAERKYRVNYSFSKIEGFTYDVQYESYVGDTPEYKLHICVDKICKANRSKLNPNSIEFVSAGYKISKSEANDFILKRNKSPFYKHNHTSDEDYAKYQSHEDFSLEQRNSEKRLETYYNNKENYIKEFGIDSWNIKNSTKDSSSFEHFLLKNNMDYDLAKLGYDSKNEICTINSKVPTENSPKEYILTWWNNRHATKRNINTVEDFKTECIHKLANRGIIGKCIFISEIHDIINANLWNLNGRKLLTFFVLGCYIFEITNLFEFLDLPKEIVGIYTKYNAKMFSYNSFIDGYHFRSDTELSFYMLIRDIISVEVLSVNKKYEIHGVNRFYDFKIQFNDKIYFIEICGGIDEIYIELQLYKQKHFNSILISKKYFNVVVNDLLKNFINTTPGAYYDH